MHDQAIIRDYLEHLLHQLWLQMGSLRQKPADQEALHELRVYIKRLRALLFFLNSLPPERKFLKIKPRWRHLFNSAGHLRDLQVQRLLAREMLPEVIQHADIFAWEVRLDKAWKKTGKNLRQLSEKDRLKLRTSVLRRLSRVSCPEMRFEIMKCAHAALEQIYSDVSLFELKAFHTLRIRLKKVQYLVEIMARNLCPDSLFLELYHRLKKITERLGNWHDQAALLDYVATQAPALSKRQDMAQVLFKHQEQGEALRDEIRHEISVCLNDSVWAYQST